MTRHPYGHHLEADQHHHLATLALGMGPRHVCGLIKLVVLVWMIPVLMLPVQVDRIAAAAEEGRILSTTI